jgi:methionyl-tRNA formyltransferase
VCARRGSGRVSGGAPRIVMCACAEMGVNVLEHLVANGMPIAQIVTLTPEQAQRNAVAGYVHFEPIAARLGIPVHHPRTYALKHEADLAFFAENRFDLLLVGGWQRLVPEAVLNTLRVGGLGLHGSSEFLPKGRGRSPVNWSLIEGKRRFIAHLFLMKPAADDGDVVAFEMFDVNEWDTCRTLYYKLSVVYKRMLLEHVPHLLAGRARPVPQVGEPSYYPKRTPADGLIDWSRPVFQIHDFIRALTHPYPGAFSYLDGEAPAFFWGAQPFDTRIAYFGAAEGEVVERFTTGEFVVNCNSGLLLVTDCTVAPRPGQRFTAPLHSGALAGTAA